MRANHLLSLSLRASRAALGFSEARLTDLRVTAPHVKVSLGMPGHIGTPIVSKSAAVLGRRSAPTSPSSSTNEPR
jgi:hypothetical protein